MNVETPLHVFFEFIRANHLFNGHQSICSKVLFFPPLTPLSAIMGICDALHDFIPFVQFKKREKHPWRSVTFSKVAG